MLQVCQRHHFKQLPLHVFEKAMRLFLERVGSAISLKDLEMVLLVSPVFFKKMVHQFLSAQLESAGSEVSFLGRRR